MMITLICAGMQIDLHAEDPTINSLIGDLFSPHLNQISSEPANKVGRISIKADDAHNRWSIECDGKIIANKIPLVQVATILSSRVIKLLAKSYKDGLVLHAGALSKDNNGVLFPGEFGSEKTLLCAWLSSKGYEYLTDEVIFFDTKSTFKRLYHPLNVKQADLDAFRSLNLEHKKIDVLADSEAHFVTPENTVLSNSSVSAKVLVFPLFIEGAELNIEPLTPAQCVMELTKTMINAKNLPSMGFPSISALGKELPAIKISYGAFEQLEPILDTMIDLLAKGEINSQFLASVNSASKVVSAPPSQKVKEAPKPTQPVNADEILPTVVSEHHKNKFLTIAMATYDDYDGVYFTLQSLRLHHSDVLDDVEIIIIDNNPRGKCGEPLQRLAKKGSNIRYIPEENRAGTAVRDLGFVEANSDFVLCLDCHVLVDPGAIRKLIEYYKENPATNDLIHGPMLDDFLSGGVLTHFNPVWRAGMYGVWGNDERGNDPDGEAFEIPMQGLGLFSCRKAAWPGFNPAFSGFGGEEGYIHEKIRQAGGKVLCLPFLRWLHRFERPLGVPYRLIWEDRIVNYLIGFDELGLDTSEVTDHFREHLNQDAVDRSLAIFNEKSMKNSL